MHDCILDITPTSRFSSCLAFVLCTSALSAQTFTDVSQTAGINHTHHSYLLIGGGTAFFDYNNDGWEDIYITGGNSPDWLYRNNGDGTFTNVGFQAGIARFDTSYTMGVTTGDIDNDDDRDIFVTRYWDGPGSPLQPCILYRNNGNGTFTDISTSAGITGAAFSVSASMGDYNLDGWLDIYVSNYIDSNRTIHNALGVTTGFAHTGWRNFLYVNNGNGTFTERASLSGVDDKGTGLACAFTDYDNDYDVDIYSVNDFGAWVVPNQLFRNEYPADSFTNTSASSGANAAIYGMGIAIGDYDEDGDLDYYLTNIGYNVLYRNNGNGTFTNMAQSAGVANGYLHILSYTFHTIGWGAVFLDYDNDARPDLFVSDGYIPAAPFIQGWEHDPNKLYKNNGNGTFTDVSSQAGVNNSLLGRGAAAGDYDNDGDLDLMVVNTNTDALSSNDKVLLYRNNLANNNHWLKVKLRGIVSNRDGFGARVELYGNSRKWIREIDGGSSSASQNSSIAHFGLGAYTNVDSLVVIWPGGQRQIVHNKIVNRTINVIENGSYRVFNEVNTAICSGDSLFAGGSWQTAAGTYFDTLGVPGIFDSIVKTKLEIRPLVSSSQYFTTCSGDSIFAAGAFRYQNGTYKDTLTTAFGCDSVIAATVAIMPVSVNTGNYFKICDGDSIFAAGAFRDQSGAYYDTLSASSGCDSIVIIEIALAPHSINPGDQFIICDGDSVYAAGAFRTEAGTYLDTLHSHAGCDSILEILITVQPSDSASSEFRICEGDSIMLGGAYQKEAGTYYDHFFNTSGCDSIIESKLVLDSEFTLRNNITIYEDDSIYLDGAWRSEPGVYRDILVAGNGCDSIIITELNVLSGIENHAMNNFAVHPNPVRSSFTLDLTLHERSFTEINLISSAGKVTNLLSTTKLAAGAHELHFPDANIPPGIYIISVKTNCCVGFSRITVL